MLEAVREWVSNSPSTRTMFRPPPTLFFTGLMILKEKKRNKTQPLVLSVEGALCVPDSGILRGPPQCTAEVSENTQNHAGHLLSSGDEQWAGFSESLSLHVWTRAVCSGDRVVPAWGWEVLGGGRPVSPGQEEGRVLHVWGPQGEPSCVPAAQDPVLCVLGKPSFSVSGQEVLSTDLSPSIQASTLRH